MINICNMQPVGNHRGNLGGAALRNSKFRPHRPTPTAPRGGALGKNLGTRLKTGPGGVIIFSLLFSPPRPVLGESRGWVLNLGFV